MSCSEDCPRCSSRGKRSVDAGLNTLTLWALGLTIGLVAIMVVGVTTYSGYKAHHQRVQWALAQTHDEITLLNAELGALQIERALERASVGTGKAATVITFQPVDQSVVRDGIRAFRINRAIGEQQTLAEPETRRSDGIVQVELPKFKKDDILVVFGVSNYHAPLEFCLATDGGKLRWMRTLTLHESPNQAPTP